MQFAIAQALYEGFYYAGVNVNFRREQHLHVGHQKRLVLALKVAAAVEEYVGAALPVHVHARQRACA